MPAAERQRRERSLPAGESPDLSRAGVQGRGGCGDSKLTNRTRCSGCSDGADPPIPDLLSKSNYKFAGQAANSSRELAELKVR